MFDKSALEAIRTWRYKPKIEGGRVVPREGARVRLDYTMR
jgi:outer membrane biosynthesis protein TonB